MAGVKKNAWNGLQYEGGFKTDHIRWVQNGFDVFRYILAGGIGNKFLCQNFLSKATKVYHYIKETYVKFHGCMKMHYSCLNSFWSVALLLLSFLVRFKNATQKFRVSYKFWYFLACYDRTYTRGLNHSNFDSIFRKDSKERGLNRTTARPAILLYVLWFVMIYFKNVCFDWIKTEFKASSRVRFDSWRHGGKGGFIRPGTVFYHGFCGRS